jgi:hypothetical protein
MYPHGQFQPVPPAPQKSTALYWVLGSIAAVLVIGGVGCAACVGVVALGSAGRYKELAASASARQAAEPLPEGQPAAGGVHNDDDSDDDGDDDGTDSEPAGGWPSGSASSSANRPATAGGGNYVCTAFASFRHCGFAGACGPRSASGTGTGTSEAAARAMALNACSGSASAQGGVGAICSVNSCRRM